MELDNAWDDYQDSTDLLHKYRKVLHPATLFPPASQLPSSPLIHLNRPPTHHQYCLPFQFHPQLPLNHLTTTSTSLYYQSYHRFHSYHLSKTSKSKNYINTNPHSRQIHPHFQTINTMGPGKNTLAFLPQLPTHKHQTQKQQLQTFSIATKATHKTQSKKPQIRLFSFRNLICRSPVNTITSTTPKNLIPTLICLNLPAY